jgi:uncharacterized membrane protein YqhA
MFRNILASSRYLIIIAVVGSFLASLTVLIYDFLTVVNIVIEVFAHIHLRRKTPSILPLSLLR